MHVPREGTGRGRRGVVITVPRGRVTSAVPTTLIFAPFSVLMSTGYLTTLAALAASALAAGFAAR